MNAARPRDAAAAVVYVGITAAVTYGLWAPVDDSDPTARFSGVVFAGLFLLHVALGAYTGRWWCVALPLVWTVLSGPAGGYDVPISVGVLFQSIFFWIPTTVASVGLRRLLPRVVRPRSPGTPRDLVSVALCLVLGFILVFALPFWIFGS